jgi:hypothetical protein
MKLMITEKNFNILFETTPKDMSICDLLTEEMTKRGIEYGEYNLIFKERCTPFVFTRDGVMLFLNKSDVPEYFSD